MQSGSLPSMLGGAKFEAQFEAECQQRDIKLFILPPRSPELNGYVEQALHIVEICSGYIFSYAH